MNMSYIMDCIIRCKCYKNEIFAHQLKDICMKVHSLESANLIHDGVLRRLGMIKLYIGKFETSIMGQI